MLEGITRPADEVKLVDKEVLELLSEAMLDDSRSGAVQPSML